MPISLFKLTYFNKRHLFGTTTAAGTRALCWRKYLYQQQPELNGFSPQTRVSHHIVTTDTKDPYLLQERKANRKSRQARTSALPTIPVTYKEKRYTDVKADT